jgi:hypothetical protein
MATSGGVALAPPAMRISPPQCRPGSAGRAAVRMGRGGVSAVSVIDRLMRPTSARSSTPKFCSAGSL